MLPNHGYRAVPRDDHQIEEKKTRNTEDYMIPTKVANIQFMHCPFAFGAEVGKLSGLILQSNQWK